ncbi:putative Bug-like extracytoplasmic solute binding receptor, TTT family [Advenella mimigardefordensis DPN7]|uniref:Putative Bug-like extracytoplasmic solute binding receptor, TTT family n=1 Tax=Advenella mimigardefordensis (strain DSM 17166 / LMG 22922 / DPN7) TaxID=1247726 RepID=W0PE46_ADVMD|nr:putative Bug-like extracytoplasmic solute binding receptor, TTT family [Advenella mimigardefordensis DPN7]
MKKNIRRLSGIKAVCAAAALTGLFVTGTAAAAYPERPITWIVPFPPGGAMDVIARTLGESLAKDLGQPIVVENKPGAGGNIGSAQVANAKPDGYTIMIVANGMAVNPSLYKKLNYDPIADFAPISLLADVPNILVTQATRKDVNSVEDVIEQARANPGKYTYASAGVGTSIHLAGALFTYLGKLDMLHVPYKGSGPAVSDLLGGQVDYMFDSITSSKPHIDSGKLKALAITTSKRSASLPDVPTVAESGLPGYELRPWFATFAPAGTPPEVIQTLQKAMVKAMDTDKVKTTFKTIGAERIGSTPEELRTYLQSETDKWKQILSETGISAQ